MANLVLNTAQMFCTLPACKKCGVQTALESSDTDASSYTAQLRIVCPECGKASEWHSFDNYCHCIPEIWRVFRMAFVDFNGKE